VYVINRCGRVMKWLLDTVEGTALTDDSGLPNYVSQVLVPNGVIVDQSGRVYVSDGGDGRMLRWLQVVIQPVVVVGEKGTGNASNQLHCGRCKSSSAEV
jgi:hypothetical protein